MKEIVLYVHEGTGLHAIQRLFGQRTDEYQLVHVTTVHDLLARVESASLIVTDFLAADAGGLDLLRRLHASRGKEIPVIVISSAKNEQLAVQSLRSGVSSFVPQKLIGKELLHTVSSVLTAASAHRCRSRIMDSLVDWECHFQLENDRTLIPSLVRYLQELTRHLGILTEPSEETRLGIALEEALLNAMYHGNLEVDSALREDDDSQFYAMIETRRKERPYSERRITVKVQGDRTEIAFVIEDEGPGFDVSLVPDPTDVRNIERVSGRGMLLMRSFMDEVKYSDRGNNVRLVKRRSPRKV